MCNIDYDVWLGLRRIMGPKRVQSAKIKIYNSQIANPREFWMDRRETGLGSIHSRPAAGTSRMEHKSRRNRTRNDSGLIAVHNNKPTIARPQKTKCAASDPVVVLVEWPVSACLVVAGQNKFIDHWFKQLTIMWKKRTRPKTERGAAIDQGEFSQTPMDRW